MQISKGKHILGYCKVTDNKEIALLFRNEANILKELGRKGLKEVPICIFCGEMTDGIKLFVQSTAKLRSRRLYMNGPHYMRIFSTISIKAPINSSLLNKAITTGY